MTDLAYFVQQVLNALPIAALYAVLAFGYGLTFGLTRRVDFTPGALFAFAGQTFVFFTAVGWERLWLIYPAALALGALAALVYTGLAATLVGRHVTRPLMRVSPNGIIVVSLALMIVLMELVRIASSTRDLWIAPVLNQRVIFWGQGQTAVVLTVLQLSNCALMTSVVLAGGLVLGRSRFGRQWRACADDRLASALMGIDAERTLLVSAMATALIMAVAGTLATAYYGNMDFGSGLMFGLKVVMIAAIGDQAAPTRSAAGAAAFGLAETMWGAYLPFAWRDIALFGLLVGLAVLFRRQERI